MTTLLAVAILCWLSFAIGQWNADRQHLALMRRTIGVIGRDAPARVMPRATVRRGGRL